MTQNSAESILTEELRKIAPEVEMEDIDRGGDLRDEFDIDSMDFLNLVTALSKRLDIPMPEADYPQMQSFDDLAAYLREKSNIM